MFTALTSSKDVLYLYHLTREEIQQLPRNGYSCPDCNQAVVLKKGTHKLPHFAHSTSCSSYELSPKETLQHLAGKQLLYHLLSNSFQNVYLEHYFPTVKQRADICIKEELALVVEYQCSSISAAEVIRRTEGYQHCGYKVRWILNHQFLPMKQPGVAIVKLSKFLQSCLFTHTNMAQTLTFLDPQSQRLSMLILHHKFSQDCFIVEQYECSMDSGNFVLLQPVHRLPAPETVSTLLAQHYERKKSYLFSYFDSKDRTFHFLANKWKKTEYTLPGYIGLPVLGPNPLGCEFKWQFQLVNFLVTRSQSAKHLSKRETIEFFLLSLPNTTWDSEEAVQLVTRYYEFLQQHRVPERPFHRTTSGKRYMEAWYRYQLLAKPSKH